MSALLSVPEVAQRCNCAESTVRELIRQNRIRHVRLGRLIRVPESALLDFIEGTK
jgi:excisionase family DNA binding protein